MRYFVIKDLSGKYLDERSIWKEDGEIIYNCSEGYINLKFIYPENLVNDIIKELQSKIRKHKLKKELTKEEIYI